MFSLHHASCITDCAQGLRTHVHSFCGLFYYFPQLSVLWQEYLSEIFCSFIYLRSSSCPLALFIFLLFCLFFFPDSHQGTQLTSSSKFQVSLKYLAGLKQIVDLSLALTHHLFCLSGHQEISDSHWVFCFTLENHWGRSGV